MIIEAAVVLGLAAYVYIILNSDPFSKHWIPEKYEKSLSELKNNIRFPHQVWGKK